MLRRAKAPARSFGLFLLAGVLTQPTSGQNPEPAETASSEGRPIAHAARVDRSPRLDGTLNDPIWNQAVPITDFRQREPSEGKPATEATEVRILYSRTEIYFGIFCQESGTNGPVATQFRRDVSQELDDYFEIVIDSRHDRRNAYVFQINPLGTQRDALPNYGERKKTTPPLSIPQCSQ